MIWLDLILFLAVGASALFHLTAAVRLRAHFRPPPSPSPSPAFPITFLRPVKPGTPHLREKLEMLARCAVPGDQVLVGVSTPEDREVALGVPGIEVIDRREPGVVNPKIAKLIPMSRLARHDRWFLCDSEVMLDPSMAGILREEWGGHGILTAGYRFRGARSLPQALDQASTLAFFWPGIISARRDFVLGAFVAVCRQTVETIGGWESLADCLAEDFQLGQRAARSGVDIRLSKVVVTLDSDPMGAREWMAHQMRVAVTHKVCAPAGWAASWLAHGTFPAMILCLLNPHEAWRWMILAGILATRGGTARANAVTLGFRIPNFWFVVPAVSFLETLFWAASWVVSSVVWAGKRYSVTREGKILPRTSRQIG